MTDKQPDDHFLLGKRWPIEQSTVRTWSLIVLVPGFVIFGVWSGMLLESISRDIATLKGRAVTRAEWAEWCYVAERSNPNFKCPSPFDLPSQQRRYYRDGLKLPLSELPALSRRAP